MKKYFFGFVLILLCVFLFCSCEYSCERQKVFVGPAGGFVFYDCDADNDETNNGAGPDGLKSDVCGWRYLEAAPADIEGTFMWGADGYYSTKIGIGTGRDNTNAMPKTIDGEKTAAQACLDYSVNGYDDWFLPSRDELNLMYKNLKKKEIGGFLTANYWGSSEYASYFGFYLSFDDGSQHYEDRGGSQRVRCIRAF